MTSPQPDDHDHDAGTEHDLVMPFVATTSHGGPYDDDAYTAGYEMGLLDAKLEAARPPNRGRLACTIRAANREQADLIAMRHGYVARFPRCMCPAHEEWAHAVFTPGIALPTVDPTGGER